MTKYVEPDPTQFLPAQPPAASGPEWSPAAPSVPPAVAAGDVLGEPTRAVPATPPSPPAGGTVYGASLAGGGPFGFLSRTEDAGAAAPADSEPKDPQGPDAAPATTDGDKPSKPSKPRISPLWAKLCVIFGAIVMVVSGFAVVGPRLLINYATAEIPIVEALPEPPPTIDGPINILMLGMDARPEDAGNNGARADTIIIAHIPASHDAVYMVSLPRDLEVEIPAFPATGYIGESAQKINAAFFFGAKEAGGDASVYDRNADLSPEGRGRGGALTAMTIDKLVPGGLRFNALVVINFDGFLSVLEVLGGVHMCVDEAVYSVHYYPDGTKPARGDLINARYGQGKYYPEGCYDMQAWEALDFARQRYGLEGSDYARQRHQQQLIKAMIDKMTSRGVLTDPAKLMELKGAAGDLLTLDLGPVPVDEWVYTLSHLRPSDMVMIKTNGGRLNNAGVVVQGNQSLTEESKQLLAALSTDTVGDFVAQHPDWVSEG